MDIYICVGSSCHLKGSYDVIEAFKSLIKENNLEDKVTLKGTFCLGKCSNPGVSIKINDEIITGVNKENSSKIFSNYVLSRICK